MFARHYQMDAQADRGDELQAGLIALAAGLRDIPGFAGGQLLRDRERPDRFVFIERWQSADAHRDGRRLLSPDLMAAVLALLAGRPSGASMDEVPLDPPPPAGTATQH